MTHRYEVRLRGSVPAAVVADLSGVPVPPCGEETLLLTRRMTQVRLQALLARFADLGLEIRELRRLAEPASPPHLRGSHR